MTTTYTNDTTRAVVRRELLQSTASLMQAEELWRVLRAAHEANPTNFHIEQAYQKAGELAYEMEDDMIAIMDRAVSLGLDPEELG